ncbi:MAG: hypothetical protein HWD60_12500 [Defluviicoccus sp.]|nr:MAG: hypothetical protein HWD60_12500 [Defluviicoccus sp.]
MEYADVKLLPFPISKPRGGTTRVSNGAGDIILSLRCWNRFEELKRGSHSGRLDFMAMRFNEKELDNIFENYFRAAVKQTDFVLRKLGDIPKAGLIDDRLRVEIKACRFLIADLTHGNQGAYWEAGYAEGLGKPVIYTCKKSAFNETGTHFDRNHHLTVLWDPQEPSEAVERLKATIRATLPEAKQQD